MSKLFFRMGALVCLLGIVAGALGSHAVSEGKDLFEIAVRYQVWSGLGLLAAAFAADRWPGPWPGRAGGFLLFGVLLFSGSLYLKAVAHLSLGLVTPLGGVCMMAGWLCLVLSPRG